MIGVVKHGRAGINQSTTNEPINTRDANKMSSAAQNLNQCPNKRVSAVEHTCFGSQSITNHNCPIASGEIVLCADSLRPPPPGKTREVDIRTRNARKGALTRQEGPLLPARWYIQLQTEYPWKPLQLCAQHQGGRVRL